MVWYPLDDLKFINESRVTGNETIQYIRSSLCNPGWLWQIQVLCNSQQLVGCWAACCIGAWQPPLPSLYLAGWNHRRAPSYVDISKGLTVSGNLVNVVWGRGSVKKSQCRGHFFPSLLVLPITLQSPPCPLPSIHLVDCCRIVCTQYKDAVPMSDWLVSATAVEVFRKNFLRLDAWV